MNHLLAETSEATPVTTDRPNLEDGYRLPLFDARSSGFGDIEPSGDVSPVLVHRFQTAAEVLGWLAFVLGLVVLVVGWWMGVDTVASVVPGSVTMKANTAVGIGAAGLAIVAHRRAWPLSLPIAMAALVTVIGWVTTFEYLTGFGGSGFDELLVREGHGAIATSNPGRMGANTAFDYALLGPALFMLALRRGRRTRQLFAASIATVGFVALLGYTVGVAELAGHLAGATKMAINTSVLHIALGLGVLFSHPDVGVVRPVVSKRVGGNIIRTHLPVALGAAMLIGALAARVIGPMTQDPASSLQLTVAILIAGAAFMVFGIGRRVDRLDAEAEVYRLQQLAAGKALRQSERELDTTFDFAPIGMSLSSRGGRLVRVNPALCDMLGYTAEQLLSMNWRDLTHPADIALNEAEHQRLQESDSPPSGTVEKRYLRSNGEVIWVLLSLAFVRDEAGDPVYSIAHSVDITERKMRETSRAADAERRFRIAFENAPIAMCLTDPDGRFLQVNPAMCEMFQYSHEQLCEFSWADLSHPDDVDESQSVIRRLLNAPEGSVEIESRFVRSDSQIVVASLRISAAGAGDGSDRYHIGQIVNLTDLRRSHQRLEELLSSKNEFIASVAHELRTPLTTVLGFAELLTDRELSVSPGERAEMIQSIVSEAADLTAIVEDLIVAARSENSDQTVAAVPVSLHAQIAQVIETYGPDFATRWHITGDPVKALADPTRVRQILRNLVNNALKYGGDDLRITSVADGHSSLVLVSDNGPGIPREERDLIFESYKRAHNARGMTGSLGLGLAVSRKLARLMGGDLTYRHQNERSVFALTLPAAPQD